MILEIYHNILYFIGLTINTEVLWVVLPLLIATIIMLFYFERYKEERPGWNTHVSNSLILLFVSVILFRYVYGIDDDGLINFVNHLSKFVVSFIVLLIGIIILSLNFEHFLPEKIARYLSSPLTLNLIAYIAILYVYSSKAEGLSIFFSLLILFILLIFIVNLIRIPVRNLFLKLKKMKERERIEDIVDRKKPIEEKKKKLKKEEKIVKRAKREVKKEEKKVKKVKLKELDNQKKEAVKLKKVVNKSVRKER
jgi:hypothetical protein